MRHTIFVLFISVFSVGFAHAQQPLFDTTFNVFADPHYKARFVIDDENGQYGDRRNAALMLFHDSRLTYIDSLSVTEPSGNRVERINYNRDNIPDLILFSLEDVRSNVASYLYLVDTLSHSLHRVKGFEEIKNPEYDSVDDIIQSYVISGTDYITFYKINDHFNAIDLGYTVNDDHSRKSEARIKHQLQKIYKKEHWRR